MPLLSEKDIGLCLNDVDDFASQMRIAKARQLRQQMEAEADKYAQLKRLAFADEIMTVKTCLTLDPIALLARDARKELVKFKETGSIQMPSVALIEQRIKDVITGVDVKVTNVCNEGLTHYCHVVEFEYNSKRFVLRVPNLPNLNSENYFYANEGKFHLGYYKNSSTIDCIGMEYIIENLKQHWEKFNGNV